MKKLIIIILFCLAPVLGMTQQQAIDLQLAKSKSAYQNSWPVYGAAIGLATAGIIYQNILDPGSDVVNSNFEQVGTVMITGSLFCGSLAIFRWIKAGHHYRKAHRIRKGKSKIHLQPAGLSITF